MIVFISRAGTDSDAFIRSSLAEYAKLYGIKLAAYDIERKEFCKPEMKPQLLHFNVTHSGEYIMCAVSTSEMGIDLERIRPDIDGESIIRRFFHGERLMIGKDFFDMFTAKEAYAKRRGKTLIEVADIPVSATHIDVFDGYSFAVDSDDTEIIFSLL